MHVREIMTTDIGTCNSDTNLEAVAQLMWDKDCGSVPVLDDSRTPIGIITDRDIAMGCAINHKALWEMTTREVLNNRTVYTCSAEEDIKTALKTMSKHHIRRLPVVDNEGHIEGMLSIDDVIACTPKSAASGKSQGISVDDTLSTLKKVSKHH